MRVLGDPACSGVMKPRNKDVAIRKDSRMTEFNRQLVQRINLEDFWGIQDDQIATCQRKDPKY